MIFKKIYGPGNQFVQTTSSDGVDVTRRLNFPYITIYFYLTATSVKEKNFDVDFYVVTNPIFRIDNKLLNMIIQKKYLFIFEDSRSKIKNYDHICKKILSKKPKFNIKIFRRDENENKLQVNEDLYNINL